MAYTSFSLANYIRRLSTPITATPFSMSAWLFFESATANNACFILDGSSVNSAGLAAEGNVSGDPITAYMDGPEGTSASAYARSSSGYSLNVWTHVCGVFSSSTLREIYVNGSNLGSATTTRTPTFDRINIGNYRGSFNALNGRIAQAAIYNKALSSGEINALAKGFSARLVAPQNLKVFAPLTRGFSDYMGDSFSQVGTVSVTQNPRLYA